MSSFNHCNLPPWVIASRDYNDDPRPIALQGVRDANARLFERLDALERPDERALVFHDFLSVKFQLHHWEEHQGSARRSLRNSYLAFLRGWGVDSSSLEGAVLKGWVESRLGLPPTFHGGRIAGVDDPAYEAYALDRIRGSARTSAILGQLDLVYEFTQYELARRRPGERWQTLWRGVHDAAGHEVLEERGRRERVVRLNNLCSFTRDPERAWEFGTTVWEVRVPTAKVFFFSGLFPTSLLRGEDEVLAVGGEYLVRAVS
jgi:NAD+--dinitrogen-reductase ADP-D-ribosyltransferase